jgi:peptide/nickel transport system substrate-binding protein
MRVWLLVALCACHAARAPSSEEVRIQLKVEPPHLDPSLAGDAVSVQITLGDVYESILVLSESVARSPDGKEMTFTLRDGVVWHDGRPFGVDDVVATFRATKSADFDDVEEVTAAEPRAVRVRFHGFRVGREDSLAHLPIMPAHVDAEARRRHPVGTGPYRFDAWEPQTAIRFVRFDRYWGARPRFDRVTYRIIPDATQAMTQLAAGELDLVPTASRVLLEKHPELRAVPYDAPSFSVVIWNCRRVDARGRRGLTQLLDRDGIIDRIYKGRARAISGPWPPGAPAADPEVKPWPFAPGEAPAVTLLLPREVPGMEKVATIWQDDAARAGVKIAIESVPWDQLLARAKTGEFDGVMLSLTTAPEQDFFANLHTGGDANYGAFTDEKVDALLESIRVEPDRERRVAMEHELHRRLHELQPMTFIVADVRVAAVSPRLTEVPIGADGVPARLLR